MATKRGPTTDNMEAAGALDSLFSNIEVSDPSTGPSDLEQAAVAIRTNPTTGDPVDSGPHPMLEQARLEYVAPDGTAHTRILRETTTIGRHTDNDIQLLDPEVSKAHLVVRRLKE